MKILFGVQTEGNGHCVQAIALKEILVDNNHSVVCALGAKKKKGIAKFFKNEFKVVQFNGFDFIFNKNGDVIIWKTFIKNISKIHLLMLSFLKICITIKKYDPDIIINFYEPMVGLTSLIFRKKKYISIGHQYAMTLPEYPQIEGFPIQKWFLKVLNFLTSINAKIIALSFYDIKNSTVLISPPILRKESYITCKQCENFILVYLINEEMLPQLINEAIKYPNENIECFTKLTKQYKTPSNLVLHNLDGVLFQQRMKVCKAVICSGGFETTSEAILQNKPVLMIPITNHFEQHANCNDAQLHGFSQWCKTIDFAKIPKKQSTDKEWFYSYKTILLNILDE